MPPQPGEVICGRIRVERTLPARFGASVFGPVVVCQDTETDRPLWLTTVDGAFFHSSVELSQFMASANGLLSLRHPGIDSVLVVDREEDYCVVGQEVLVDARPLLAYEGEFVDDPGEVGRCAVQIARGLAFLHRKGVIHGLLSPMTVLEWEGSYVLWQQGIAPGCATDVLVRHCRADDEHVYAPEFLRGNARLTPTVDVYAWGVTVARLAAHGDPLEAVHEAIDGMGDLAIPDGLDLVVRRALSADPDRRPRDGVHLLAMIEEAGLSRSGAHRVPAAVSSDGLSLSDLAISGDSSTELSADDVEFAGGSSAEMMMEDGEAVVRAPPTAPDNTRRSRPRDATAPLATLAQEHAGVEAKDAQHVGESGAEPDLLELAGSAPIALPMVTEARDAPMAQTFEPENDPRRGGPVDVDRERVPSFRPPRTPGPHGPRARPMAMTIAIVAALLPAASLLHVATAHGLSIGVEVPQLAGVLPRDQDPPEESSGSGAPALAADIGGGDPQLPDVGGPSAEELLAKLPPQCAEGMVQITKTVCMDTAEYPGMRRSPMINVTHREAAASCELRGARLCTRREWSRACRGSKGWLFPYGPGFAPDRCNTASVADFPQEVGLSASYQDCRTPTGIYDLVGNVGEWVAEGLAVGGDSTTSSRVATCEAKGRPPPGYQGRDLGFRCCAEMARPPLPGTSSLGGQ